MRRLALLLLLGLLILTSSRALPRPGSVPPAGLAAPAAWVRFEPLDHPARAPARYLARLPGATVLLGPGGTAWAVPTGPDRRPGLRMSFAGAAPQVVAVGEERLRGYSNYLIGGNRTKWRTGVPHFSRVRYRDLYPGVDLVYHGRQALEYDLLLRPGADAAVVALAFEGADTVELRPDGGLAVSFSGSLLVQPPPVAWQDSDEARDTVAVRFRRLGQGLVGLELGPFDHSRPLVIDPLVLVYSTYVGGSGPEDPRRIAVDADGMLYLVGQTWSTDFPATPGAFGPAPRSAEDAYIVKLDPDQAGANSLVYATYLGSSASDGAVGIAVDDARRAFVTGTTSGGDFPTTSDGFKPTWSPTALDDHDAFLAVLGPDGDQLAYGTFFGGDRHDDAADLAIRGQHIAYLAGNTDGGSFPTTSNAFDASGHSNSPYLSVLDLSTGTLLYSSVVHGSGLDYARGLAVSAGGVAYLAGIARSNDFPTTTGAFMPNPPPGRSSAYGTLGGFLSVFDPARSGAASLLYSTYLGAGDPEDVDLDAAGAAYVVGTTSYAGFPTTPGAYDTACEDAILDASGNPVNVGCQGDAYLMKVDPSLTGAASLRYSTRLGGTWGERGRAIAVDQAGQAYVTGRTGSPDFPLVNGRSGVPALPLGGADAFVAAVSPSGAGVVFADRLGGTSGWEEGTGIALDGAGDVCLTGSTQSTDFPVINGFDASRGGYSDAFAARLRYSPCSSSTTRFVDPGRFDWDDLVPHICLTWDRGESGLFEGVPRRCPVGGCPKCGPMLSRTTIRVELPEVLGRLYGDAAPILFGTPPPPGAGGRPGAEPAAVGGAFARRLGTAPIGRFFTEELRDAVLEALQAAGKSREAFGAARDRVSEALNALELDWRAPAPVSAELKAGTGSATDLGGLAILKSRELAAGTRVALHVEPGLPALPRGYQPMWPVATYRFEVTGKRAPAGSAEAAFYAGWASLDEGRELRLLAWDGRRFRDVTRGVDYRTRTVWATVDLAASYVLVQRDRCLRLATWKPAKPVN